MAEHEPLTFLPQALTKAGYKSPGYQTLFKAAHDGLIPATHIGKGRWTFDPDDLSSIAQVLTLKTNTAA